MPVSVYGTPLLRQPPPSIVCQLIPYWPLALEPLNITNSIIQPLTNLSLIDTDLSSSVEFHTAAGVKTDDTFVNTRTL